MRASCIVLILVATVNHHLSAADEGPPFPRIANCYAVKLTPESTPADIKEIARFDLLIGGVWCNWDDPESRRKLAANIAEVRKRNPHVIILDFSTSAPYASPKDKSLPVNGWLLQPDGTRILGWPGTAMVNLLKPAVIDWHVSRCERSVGQRGFDGVFMDCMGSGFDWWACNIESGKRFTPDADEDGRPDERRWLNNRWTAAKAQLSHKVREAIGPRAVLMANQAGDWGRPDMNGILLEDWLDGVLDHGRDWDSVLHDYLAWCGVRSRPNVTTIVSSSGLEPPFEAWKTMKAVDREALLLRGRSLTNRMRFGLATTLMGDGYYAYDLHTRWRGQRWWYPEYDAPLGYAKGPAAKQPDGTWRREFDGGTVIVNPTLFDAEAGFAARRKDASSEKVDTRFIIPPNDGRILLPTKDAVTAGSLPDPSPALTLHGRERIVERSDRILCRLDGAAALFDAQGRMLCLNDGQRTLVGSFRAMMVSDHRWRDFAYVDCRHEKLPDGRLRFTGKRTEGAAMIGYERTVDLQPRAMKFTDRYEGLSDARIHAWRHQMDFPVVVYSGGQFETQGVKGALPAERSPSPRIAGDLREVTLTPPAGPHVSVTVSGGAMLADERHYGSQAYRLGHSAKAGELKRGERREYFLELRFGEIR